MATNHRTARSLALGLILVTALAACGGDDGDDMSSVGPSSSTEDAAADAVTVDIVEFKFDPTPITVAAGGQITFTNSDTADHIAVANDGAFNTDLIKVGDSATVTVAEAGTYEYYCSLHPFMKATVVAQ